MTGPRELRPCGTRAAYKRHLRNRETPCAECRKAESRAERTRRKHVSPGMPPRAREIRDPVVPYRWRGRRYPWAVAVLERVEAELGRPEQEEAAA